MGAESTYYCLDCGETLTDKPTGQCPSCHKPYDLNFNITYTIIPRPPGLEAAIVSFVWSFIFAFIYLSFVVIFSHLLALLLPSAVAVIFMLLGGGILILFVWATSLKMSRITSLMTLATGFCWGSMLAVALANAYGNVFFSDVDPQLNMTMYITLAAILFFILLPSWGARQLYVRWWRAKAMATTK